MEKKMSSAENTEWKPLLVKSVGKTGDAGARMVTWCQTGYPDSRPISRSLRQARIESAYSWFPVRRLCVGLRSQAGRGGAFTLDNRFIETNRASATRKQQ